MPLAKSLKKVSKQIQHKKGQLHPRGRKAAMLARATLREEKVGRLKLKHTLQKTNDNMIISFIQDCIKSIDGKDTFTTEDVQGMVEEFIKRNDAEIAKLKKERRRGRPASKRQDLLEMKREAEWKLYASGWKLPDLSDIKNVEMFKAWGGDLGGLTAVKFVEIKRPKGDVQMS